MFAIPLTTYFEPYSHRRVPRTGYSFVDPATEARERLVRAVKEQQAAQQAYTNILAQHELAQLGLADLGAHRPSFSDFVLDLSRPTRGRSFYNTARDIYTAQEIQHQHELAIRAKREELIRQHRLKVALAQEDARHREELQRRQELIEAQRRQQQQRRAEIQRRAAILQQQEQAQAIALALAFAQEFFGAQEKETETETAQPVKTCAGGCRRVRFAGPSKAPGAKATSSTQPAAAKSNPDVTLAPVASTSSPIRVTIRETKGKASSHVRVNSTPSAASTTPADAHTALAILSSDLDGLLAPTYAWASEAHRRHSLNQLLEQVDAIQSGGEESVRDVRRTLVRRVERALEGLPDEHEVPAKFKGVEIHEPQTIPVLMTVKDDTATDSVVEALAQTVTTPEVEGYEVPDFMEAAPATATTATSTSTDPIRVEEPNDEPAPLNAWSSTDPTAVAGPIVTPIVTLNGDVEVLSLHGDDSAQPSPASQFSQLSDPVKDAVDFTPKRGSALGEDRPKLTTPDQSIKTPVSGNASDGEDAYELL